MYTLELSIAKIVRYKLKTLSTFNFRIPLDPSNLTQLVRKSLVLPQVKAKPP